MTRTTHHKPGSRSATSLDSVEVEVTRRTLSKAETWKHGQYIRHKIPSPWLLEAGSLVLSISSMVAILIILTRNNGIAVNEWTLSISINTLVSVLGVISRASLGLTVAACLGQQKWNWFRDHRDEIQVFDKFDRASQGAAGSLLAVKCFLNASRIRSCAILGAVATIAALATGPMLQASISLDGQLTNSSGVASNRATVPMAHNLDLGQLLYGGYGWIHEVEKTGGFAGLEVPSRITATPDFGLSSSITEGFYLMSPRSAAKEKSAAFQCTTGNCTWPVFSTAAVCSSCNDVTSYIKKRHIQTCTGWTSDGVQNSPDRVSGEVAMESVCTSYELPYGHIRQVNGRIFDPLENSDVPPNRPGEDYHLARRRMPEVLLTVGITSNFTNTLSFRDADTTFISFLIFRAHDNFIYKGELWEDTMPTATECALHFCAQTYQSSAITGNLSEKILSSRANRERESWSFSDHRNDEEVIEHSNSLDRSFPALAPSENLRASYRTDLQIKIPSDDSDMLPPNTLRTFNISQSTILGAQIYLAELLFRDDGYERLLRKYNNSLSDILVFPPSGTTSDNDIAPVADVLWNSTNLTQSFETLARRMTTQLRDSSDLSVSGTVQQWVFVIRVNWNFLILPTMTMLIGVSYSVFVMIQTRCLRMPIWLGSVIAVLCYGCNEESQAVLKALHCDAARDDEKKKQMDALQVRLVDGKNGYELDALSDPDDGDELQALASSVR